MVLTQAQKERFALDVQTLTVWLRNVGRVAFGPRVQRRRLWQALTTNVPAPWRLEIEESFFGQVLIYCHLVVGRVMVTIRLVPVTHENRSYKIYTELDVTPNPAIARLSSSPAPFQMMSRIVRHGTEIGRELGFRAGPLPLTANERLALYEAWSLFPVVFGSDEYPAYRARFGNQIRAAYLYDGHFVAKKNTRHLPPPNRTDPVSLNLVDPRNAYYLLPNVLPNGRIQSVYSRNTMKKLLLTGKSPMTRKPIGHGNVGRIDVLSRDKWRTAVRKVLQQQQQQKPKPQKTNKKRKRKRT